MVVFRSPRPPCKARVGAERLCPSCFSRSRRPTFTALTTLTGKAQAELGDAMMSESGIHGWACSRSRMVRVREVEAISPKFRIKQASRCRTPHKAKPFAASELPETDWLRMRRDWHRWRLTFCLRQP